MGKRILFLALAVACGCGSLLGPHTALAQTLPSDFEDVAVTSVAGPTSLAFTPDGRLLITTQGGQLRVYQNGALVATPALDLASRLCTNSERGLLGIAVDPNFAANNFIYLYYTGSGKVMSLTVPSYSDRKRV